MPCLLEAVEEAAANFGAGHWRTVRAVRLLAERVGPERARLTESVAAAADPEHPEVRIAHELLNGGAD